MHNHPPTQFIPQAVQESSRHSGHGETKDETKRACHGLSALLAIIDEQTTVGETTKTSVIESGARDEMKDNISAASDAASDDTDSTLKSEGADSDELCDSMPATPISSSMPVKQR